MSPVVPDYRGGSIVNLMASIGAALDGGQTGYPTLDPALCPDLGRARTILLLVIDGLGERWLQRHAGGSLLAAHLRGRLTSVCPSTTASAIPAFLTGVAPQQHGFTGWFTWFAELGAQLTVLPFQLRLGGLAVPPGLLSPADLSGAGPFADRLPVPAHLLMPEWLAASRFNLAFSGAAEISGYNGLPDLCRQIVRLARAGDGRRFLHAYWPGYDAIAHEHGAHSTAAEVHFQELDGFFARLLDGLAGSGTALLVTADHGFVDTTAESRLYLERHPRLERMLTMPLCGEPRLAFCYVDAERRPEFERYLEEHLSHAVRVLPSRWLLEEGWFGLGRPHPQLHRRIGDYALLLRHNFSLTGRIPGERRLRHVGVHGGVSEDEMYVPLVYALP
ncbi:MAG TPA: phosphodiesterase [Sedimenticola thiotaurini]|uniref:Phosphodiesterase n=1 Tax=Sedimenticola thiotaurini TaxID=1543721 RepID=A0A831W821_9GAMM|nr:phosphodiesterase [Sedimenticola thiotaurini]